MRFSRDFLRITSADFIVRSAYQMGKTPLLPIFAATLGADGAFLGFIVSVSTLTGLVLKPFVGILSDRWGRRLWLLVGTGFFVAIPFFYQFVYTPEQLFFIRIIHGLATAIYGPVTLAYIAELKPDNLAEGLGWFSMARSGGYIVGPALAGWLLLSLDPATVFTIIGLLSSLALLPVILLRDMDVAVPKQTTELTRQIARAVQVGVRTPGIWLSGWLEAGAFIVLYTLKAFLPVYALALGMNVALVGLFFSVQEAAHILAQPLGGRFGDRVGYMLVIAAGMLLLGGGLALVPLLSGMSLLLPAVLTGVAQAFIFPATVALVSRQIVRDNLGAGMGFVGMMQNLGKVIGPVLGGFLIQQFSFEAVVYWLAFLLVLGASGLLIVRLTNEQKLKQDEA
jgi:MFS family permease